MATYRQRDGIIELNYITDIYSSDKKVIRKNVKGKCMVYIEDIKVIDYHYDLKGKIDPTKCRVLHSDNGWMVLNETYDELSKYKYSQQPTITGFQNKLQLKQNKIKR